MMILLIIIVLSTTSQITLAESSVSYTTTSVTTNNGLISVPTKSDSSSIENEKTNYNNVNEEDVTEEWKWRTCSSHKSCTDCYDASSTCHWCSHDNKCHVKTSPLPFGCITGASCDGSSNNNNSTKAVEHCADHKTCSTCSDSSWGCHWCASDEKCHAKFSRQGCTLSTDCYAINRCQRLEPERMVDPGIFSSASFAGVGPVAKGVLGVLMGLILCCSTLCFGGVTFLKCAVDDLVGEPVELVEDGVVIRVNDHSDGGLARQQQQNEYQYERVVDTAEADEGGQQLKQDDDDLEMPLMQNEKGTAGDGVEHDGEEGSRAGKKSEHEDIEETPAVLLPKRDAHAPILRRAADGAASISQMSRRSMSSNRVTPRGSSIKRMYCGCQLCYFFTVISTIILFIVGMSYAPRQPHINVCTNELAWKSIVEGMASLKMSASFDLLISVYNPNKFEVDLSNGHGQFHHDDQYVGSFDIPEGKISENAISDIVVKVTFELDKWSALSLTSEYYQGKLKFVVGGHVHIGIPGLGNYQFDAKFDDIHVNVNDPSMDDTHLCACPGWQKL